MTNSKRKGKDGELELAAYLRDLFPHLEIRRGQQYSGLDGEDVVGLPRVHLECKRGKRIRLRQAMDQAIQDAAGDKLPMVCHREDRQLWLMTICLKDLKWLINIGRAWLEIERIEKP